MFCLWYLWISLCQYCLLCHIVIVLMWCQSDHWHSLTDLALHAVLKANSTNSAKVIKKNSENLYYKHHQQTMNSLMLTNARHARGRELWWSEPYVLHKLLMMMKGWPEIIIYLFFCLCTLHLSCTGHCSVFLVPLKKRYVVQGWVDDEGMTCTLHLSCRGHCSVFLVPLKKRYSNVKAGAEYLHLCR